MTIRSRVDLVAVDVLLTDARGTIVQGMRPHDFDILDEATPQEIAHFSQDEIPLAIALLVDVSGSMRVSLKSLRQGLIRALPTLKPEDRVALLSFNNAAKLRVEFTSDAEGIIKSVSRLKSGGSTNILDSLYVAAQYLHESAPSRSRRVIFLLSDTISLTGSKHSPGEMLLESEAALFVIRVPFIDERGKLFTKGHVQQRPLAYEPLVDELAFVSGGLVIDLKHPDAAQSAVEHLFRMLKVRHTIGFYPNPRGEPASIRRLEVRLKNTEVEEALPGISLTYRNRYRVPPEPAQNPPDALEERPRQ